jgi:hypothetical protein
MAFRITDYEKDLPRLNIELQRLDQLEQRINKLNDLAISNQQVVIQENLANGVQDQNNLTFTWTGATLTMSWAPGYVKDHQGHYNHVAAGSQVLAASTYYWVAWNTIHQTMSFNVNLDLLHGKPSLLVLCQVFTGTGAQTGAAGGGGTAVNGRDLSGLKYKNF